MSKVESILIRPKRGGPVQIVSACEVNAGYGIVGDHHYRMGCPDKDQITLIETEALEAATRDYSTPLSHEESGRNLLTSGVYLNHLVGKTFKIGSASFKGIELCEPCGTLERTSRKGVIKALIHRGGLRAEILQSGHIKAGDSLHLS